MSSKILSPPYQAPLSQWFVYLLRCADQTLYCGITTNLEKRLRQHNGELIGGAKYTKVRQPCTLVYFEEALNRSEASKREAVIKKMPKAVKEVLVEGFLAQKDQCFLAQECAKLNPKYEKTLADEGLAEG